jgi:hypothetical protein
MRPIRHVRRAHLRQVSEKNNPSLVSTRGQRERERERERELQTYQKNKTNFGAYGVRAPCGCPDARLTEQSSALSERERERERESILQYQTNSAYSLGGTPDGCPAPWRRPAWPRHGIYQQLPKMVSMCVLKCVCILMWCIDVFMCYIGTHALECQPKASDSRHTARV